MTDIAVVSLLSNLNKSHIKCNASRIYLDKTFMFRLGVQFILKNVRRNKKVNTKGKSETIPEADSLPHNGS